MNHLHFEAKRLKDLLYNIEINSESLKLLPSAFEEFALSISDSTRNSCLSFIPELIRALYLPIDPLPNIRAIEKLISTLSWKDIRELDLVPYILTGATCGNEDIELFCLKMLSKSAKSITLNAIDENIISCIISCISSKHCSCANKAIEIICDLNLSSDMFKERLLSSFLALSLTQFFSLEDSFSSSSTIISRFLTLILKLSSQSFEMFKFLASSSLIHNMMDLCDSNDLLMKLCKLDFLSSLLALNYTLEWLESYGYFKEAISPFLVFQSRNIDVDTELLIIQSCKFIESMKYISFKDFKRIDSSNNLISRLVENLSYKSLSSSLYKANLFTIAGIFCFSDDFSEYIYFKLNDMSNLTETDNGLSALELIFSSPSDKYTQLFFEQKLSSKAMFDIMMSAKSPFESTRYSALLILKAIVKHPWGILKCVELTPLMEFILSRTIDEYFDKIIKYDIVKIMEKTGRHLLGPWEEEVLRYVMKGVFGTSYQPGVLL
ncbi:hypothetical protein T552_03154 [Pneumocystis carinii B80]|uniref:26S proteasome non-ATPase regulatory subunit 5 n=1 Tax=Pneumocystis carinii (strain B80) TaxID=1408658 RepID=A0A0W4ZBS1_PNEC8|nr:hypothetical protein T552_03154 [Pneumocystis carinii B80]KTW25880.1 hypothetical protein T552_03154 [Pneumocystis carinii B80]